LKSGRKKLPEDFVYTQYHKSIWNSFCNFFDERLAEEDLSEMLDEDEITRIKTPPPYPPLFEFEPANPGDVETKKPSQLEKGVKQSKTSLIRRCNHIIWRASRSSHQNLTELQY
jgi:hypothetical protein